MPKDVCVCSWCGGTFERYRSAIRGRKMLFCSRRCLAHYRSKEHNPDGRPVVKRPDLSEYNRLHNSERMTPEVREKISKARTDSGAQVSYRKHGGVHEHRAVAEQMLGRPLRNGEVVHHINRDKRDNRPENLMVFESQAEHARWHKLNDGRGGSELDEVHTA